MTPCPVWDASRAVHSPPAIFPTFATPWPGSSSGRLSWAESEMGNKEREALLFRWLWERLICSCWSAELRAELLSRSWTLGATVPPWVVGL